MLDGPVRGPSDPSRRRFLQAGSAAAAALSVGRSGASTDTPARPSLAWSTERACPGDLVHLTAHVPGSPDGAQVRFDVVGPDGATTPTVAPVRQGMGTCAVRLTLPSGHARPGTHTFRATARLADGERLGPAQVDVIAARFSFGL